MEVGIKSYRDLHVWQKSMDLAEAVYRRSAALPREEIYGLTFQMRRAAISIPANIAEGYGRDASGSYVHFLKIAGGSLRELETHLLLSQRLKLLPTSEVALDLDLAEQIGKMLTALVKSIEARMQSHF